MRDVCYRYSALTVDHVTLDSSEVVQFSQPAASASYGVFYFGGSTNMLEGAVPGRVFDTVGSWRPNAADGWSNDVVGHAPMILQASVDGCSWLCMSRNDSGEREVQHVSVDGVSTIPAGWGFVVALGEVAFEGKTASQFAYVKPRTVDFETVGTADLLLVR